MNDDDKGEKKKKKGEDNNFPFDINFDDINIDEIKKNLSPFFESSPFGKIIDEMLKKITSSFVEGMDISKFEDLKKSPFVYGFKFGIGPDGKPRVNQFGNIKQDEWGKLEGNDVREPLIDVFKEKTTVRVIAEVPGIGKGDVKLTGKENSLTIKAFSETRKYEKTVALPVPVDIKTARAKYNNGVLEVIIDRMNKEKEDGIDIDVE